MPVSLEAAHQGQRPGASDEVIQRLENWVGSPLPDGYLNFLRFTNGVEDWSCLSVVLWAIEDIEEHNLGSARRNLHLDSYSSVQTVVVRQSRSIAEISPIRTVGQW
jgi:hypothetical protein